MMCAIPDQNYSAKSRYMNNFTFDFIYYGDIAQPV